MNHPWTLSLDALKVLPYFSSPTPIKGSSDHIQLTSNGIARALLIGKQNFSTRAVPERPNDLDLTVGPSSPPSIDKVSLKASKAAQTSFQLALYRAKEKSVSVVLIADQARDHSEQSRYVVLGFFNILQLEETKVGCRCLFQPNLQLNPLSLRLVSQNIWSGIQCSTCSKISHIEDWNSLICSACSTPNHHQLPPSLPLHNLRPPQRMVAQDARMDLGSPFIPPSVSTRLISLADGSDVRSYQLAPSFGKQVLVHHVLSRERGGGLVIPNRALEAMQARKVPLERMWSTETSKKTPAARLPIMTHTIGLEGPSCVPSFPRATRWADAEDWLLDVVEFMNVRSTLSAAGGLEFTQLVAACQQPGLNLLRTPRYSPPTRSTFSFLNLGSDVSITFRPRKLKSSKVDNLQFRLVQHGDVIVVEGDTDELDWIVSVEAEGEHFAFVAQHIPDPPPLLVSMS